MRIHQLSESEALASFGSAAEGLSSAEAQRRLEEFGPNRVEELRREHPLVRLLREFVHFFALILWLAAGLACFAAWSARKLPRRGHSLKLDSPAVVSLGR